MTRKRWLGLGGAAVAVALALTACSSSDQRPPVPSITPSPSATAQPTTSSPAPLSPLPGSATAIVPPAPPKASWPTGKREKTYTLTGTTLPVLNSIAVGAHPSEGFDRITFDFLGPIPGYVVEYVPQVTADGSGAPVSLAGSAFLQVVFKSANAHFDDGTTPPGLMRERSPNYARLHSYKLAGDFEGVVSVGIGVNGKAGPHKEVGFRIGELPGQTHSRLYIDLQR